MTTRDSGGQSRGTRREESADQVEDTTTAPATGVTERHEKLSEDVDALLDEIDGVLEENAEEFIKGYVQKGGQ